MNKALLKYEMERKGISVASMVDALGISRSAFWKKCNGVSEFRVSEMEKIVQLLDLKDPTEIFFGKEVS